MKSTWNYKLLQFLNAKKQEEGFTLIELLVVIIIIGILSAIALPAFLNQANRARQSEASTYIGSINRAQQAYRLENRTFADDIALLGIGIQTTTEFYSYTAPASTTGTGASLANNAYSQARPSDEALLGFAGITYTLQDSQQNSTTTALLCKATTPGDTNTPTPTITGTAGVNPVISNCP